MLGLGGLPGLGGPAANDGDAEAGEGNNLDVPAGCNMGRRRSRAVLYQLSGHYKPEKGGVKTKLKLGNVSMRSWEAGSHSNHNNCVLPRQIKLQLWLAYS